MTEPLIIGNYIIETDYCASTNDFLRKCSEHSFLAEGTVLFATHQTAGRGQIGTIWHSQPGDSLTFSLWLKPKFLHPIRQFLLNMAVSNAVVSYMRRHISPESCIKWPNDLYSGNKKSGGILIENILSNEQISGSVVGIGINLNQTSFSRKLPNPVSWKQITGESYHPRSVLEHLLPCLDEWYHLLRIGAIQKIKETYTNHLLGFGTLLGYEDDTGSFKGTITGVDDSGRLQITKETGEACLYRLKEVRFKFQEN